MEGEPQTRERHVDNNTEDTKHDIVEIKADPEIILVPTDVKVSCCCCWCSSSCYHAFRSNTIMKAECTLVHVTALELIATAWRWLNYALE